MGSRKRDSAGIGQCRQHRFFAEQSGKPIRIESGTTADRIARIEESAKHRVSDSLSRLLRCTCQVYLPLRVLRHLQLSLLEPLRHSTLTSSPRAETVMCLLPSSVAYHRLVFPGLDNSIYRHFNITKISERLCSRMFSPCRSRGSCYCLINSDFNLLANG